MGKENIIGTKTKSFAVRIIKFCKILADKKEYIIDEQQYKEFNKDLKEIIAILTASIKTLKSKK
jgi:hypothetical protein